MAAVTDQRLVIEQLSKNDQVSLQNERAETSPLDGQVRAAWRGR